MNRTNRGKWKNRIKFKLSYLARCLEIKPYTNSFTQNENSAIGRIYVINLDRKPKRWKQIKKELTRICTKDGEKLLDLTRRFSAIDARYLNNKINKEILIPKYTLKNQLTVEPNEKIPSHLDTDSLLIDMSPQEIAVALSHIEIWKLIVESNKEYTLILEDDVYFKPFFTQNIDDIWLELERKGNSFDILFLSYEYVKSYKSTSTRIKNKSKVINPTNGIWQASGYVLSKKGAQKLLNLLPVFGPIDLWLNLVFNRLDVYLASKPIIIQRVDVPSTNSYSIMPIFSKIGLYIGNDQSNFVKTNLKYPVFVFGPKNSGLSSIANALMILGYTCCYNLENLPSCEVENFWSRKRNNIFNSYVNISSLQNVDIKKILNYYPDARFIYTYNKKDSKLNELNDRRLHLPNDSHDKWELICNFLDIEYPAVPFPEINDFGNVELSFSDKTEFDAKELKFDDLPWIINTKNKDKRRIEKKEQKYCNSLVLSQDSQFCLEKWKLRNDTFPSNLAIFKPENLKISDDNIKLQFNHEITSVRSYTSAAIVSSSKFLYGNFKVNIRPSNISGLITGVFLHRNSPHQEIDIEFLGKDTTKMLINVFFNPGIEGSKLEYGYRGTPVIIDLGFDASEKYHLYEIHWECDRIKWYVDGYLVYERVMYFPTPIPYLPMEFNVNLWHSQSKEFAGKLDYKMVPALSCIKSIEINY